MKKTWDAACKATRSYWNSKWYMPSVLAVSCISAVFDIDLIGMFVLAALAIVMLVLCDDMMSLVCPIFCIFLSSIEFYRDYSVLTDYMWYAIVPFAAALIFNLVYYRTSFVKGRFFYPQLAVSVALSLGGLFCIPAKQYFSPSALYFSVGSGFFMLFVYCLTISRLKAYKRSYDRVERLARAVFAAGLLAAFLVFEFYIENAEEFLRKGTFLFFKPRNYVSSVLMMAIPMSCIYIKRNNLNIISMLFMYVGMLLTGSRSGLLFGTLALALSVAFVYITNKKSRRLYNVLLIIAAIPVVYAAVKVLPELYAARMANGFFNEGDATRIKFIKFGISDFLAYPIFGIGVGNLAHFEIFKAYTPGSIVYFHNIVIQVMASLGVVGIAAYLWNFCARVKMFWENRKNETLIFAISYLAILLMSFTNPGMFCPFPEGALIVLMLSVAEVKFAKQ